MNKDRLYDNDALLLKISQGDQGAFNILFERYRNQLFTYLIRITKSTENSEEIVLDVFLKIWHGKQLLPRIENFEAFIYRIAHNKAIDFLRSLKRNPVIQQQVWALVQEPSSDEDADKQLLFKNTEAMIGDAANHLSPQRQKVFYLRHHAGFTNEEIARTLQLSPNTVRNHLSASLEFIRKFISAKINCLFFFI